MHIPRTSSVESLILIENLILSPTFTLATELISSSSLAAFAVKLIDITAAKAKITEKKFFNLFDISFIPLV